MVQSALSCLGCTDLPGVFFGQSRRQKRTKLYSARVIPFKGSWIEFATDINNVMYAYIDEKKNYLLLPLFKGSWS